MPELTEDMYCSQQICIPPTFPYLLRQYAKAAIRTQPTDLLRWSTAYFRCLSLNLPPPVKPRLEYPIPKSHFGLTPGWLRALMYQLQNNTTVSFKVLWDRWIGACLQHQNLIEVLCLGEFNNPEEIPWFRFVALCAAHLTENLTQTMILVCEILTEEPEGGSAMVPLEVFTDVYQFLAAIDASEPQTLRNLYFTESLLSLYREPSVVEAKESISEVEEEAEEESVEAEEVKEIQLKKGPKKDAVGVVISCPDIGRDDYKTEEDFPLTEEEPEQPEIFSQTESKEAKSEEAASQVEEDVKTGLEDAGLEALEAEQIEGAEDEHIQPQPAEKEHAEEVKEELQSLSSNALLEDLEKVRKAQRAELQKGTDGEEALGEEEETEELDTELEKLKRLLTAPPGMEASESEIFPQSEGTEEHKESVTEELPPEEEFKGEDVYVEAVPGIGPVVPERLVQAVVVYMGECAKNQHGMVMPRNIRHYTCPPLEVLQ